jgi:hypothetical protein
MVGVYLKLILLESSAVGNFIKAVLNQARMIRGVKCAYIDRGSQVEN